MAVVEITTGMIIMWSGAIGDIPDGFALCDGTNGTPNLRGRFIVGAGGAYNVNDTGGSNTHTHTASGLLINECLDSGAEVGPGAAYDNCLGSDQVDVTIDAGSSVPPYYALAYIMRL